MRVNRTKKAGNKEEDGTCTREPSGTKRKAIKTAAKKNREVRKSCERRGQSGIKGRKQFSTIIRPTGAGSKHVIKSFGRIRVAERARNGPGWISEMRSTRGGPEAAKTSAEKQASTQNITFSYKREFEKGTGERK